MSDVFLSYSREDQATARRFAEGLDLEGFTVWWDQSLSAGETFDQVTTQALKEARAVVVLWSRTSVESRWVRSEATLADRYGTLVPVMIEPCERPIQFELMHAADLSAWKGNVDDLTWKGLVGSVRKMADRHGSVSATPPAPAVEAVASAGSPRSSRARLPIAIALLTLLAVLAGAWMYMQRDSLPADAATAAAAATSSERVGLAVLPFDDMSPNKDQEYLSDGLAEEILNQLAPVRALRVIGRTSSFAFKGKNEDLRTIASKLGVENLLEGSVRKQGNEIRMTAQLIDGRDGSHRWSKTYEGDLNDVFALQEEIARDVAKALSVTLGVDEISRVQGGTSNYEAYERVLQSRLFAAKGYGAKATSEAQRLAREAVTLDPQYAHGWMQLGAVLAPYMLGSLPESQRESASKERQQALDRVQQLAPDAWFARVARGYQLLAERKWVEVDALGQQLLAAGPLTAADWERGGPYFQVSSSTGRLMESTGIGRQFLEIDPNNLALSRNVQMLLTGARRDDLAEREYERSVTLDGIDQEVHFFQLLRLVARNADPSLVQAQYRKVLESEGLQSSLVRELSLAGPNRNAARGVLRAAFEEPENQELVRMRSIAFAADAFGDPELAMEALGRAIREFDGHALYFQIPRLRTDPRFKALIREAGIYDFWRTTGKWSDFCKPLGDDDFECQ